MIPEIQTGRLLLTAPARDDFADYFRLANLPEIVRFVGGVERTEAQVWASFLANIGAWSLLGYGMWLVKRRDTGALIGLVGFPGAMRGHGAGFDEYPEAGWLFDGAAHGQGFANEAMAVALGWFDGQGFADRCVCMIDPLNGASLKLADRLGFTQTRLSEFDGDMLQLFERRN